jgi:hypothetical protein
MFRHILTNTVSYTFHLLISFSISRHKVNVLYLKLCCSLNNQFTVHKWVSIKEKEQRLKRIFLHFSDNNSDSGGECENCIAIRSVSFAIYEINRKQFMNKSYVVKVRLSFFITYDLLLRYVGDTYGNAAMTLYFLCQLGAFRMLRCKEGMWKLCTFRYGLHLSNLIYLFVVFSDVVNS